jgi:hypothetical protein
MLSSVGSSALPYFSTLFHKRGDFEKINLLNTKCMLWFSLQLLSEMFLILRIGRNMIKIYTGFHVQYSLFLSDFNETWIIYTDFPEVFRYKTSWESVKWEPRCCGPTDGHDEVNSCFWRFCKRAGKPRHNFSPSSLAGSDWKCCITLLDNAHGFI